MDWADYAKFMIGVIVGSLLYMTVYWVIMKVRRGGR